jgi:CheY-like chemotaxis protein
MKRDTFVVNMVILAQRGDNTGLLEGNIHLNDTKMLCESDGNRIVCPLESVERVTVDQTPDALEQHFDDGVVVQWSTDENRWRLVVDFRSDRLYDFLSRVCAGGLADGQVRVAQKVTPHSVTSESTVREQMAETSVAIDQESKAVTFETADVRSVDPKVVTTVREGTRSHDGTQHDAVVFQTLFAEETIETALFNLDERERLLRDYVAAVSTVSETGGPIRVLLIDDEPGLTEVGKLHLKDKHEKLSVECATGTREAFDLLTENDYECVVTDYAMPEGGAPAIVRTNKRQPRPSEVIVFSRKERDRVPDEELPTGIDVWVTKEGDMEQYYRLGNTIKRLVAERRSTQR